MKIDAIPKFILTLDNSGFFRDKYGNSDWFLTYTGDSYTIITNRISNKVSHPKIYKELWDEYTTIDAKYVKITE